MKKYSGWFLLSGPCLFILFLLIGRIDGLTPAMWAVLGLAAWMVLWWVTDVVPMAVTALLPMVVLPAVGIFSVGEATAPYASSIIFLFMGGFLIALALEKHQLHLRIALNLLRLTGTSGNGIILGFMLATAGLSMWISNTATAVMMLPVATSVINLLGHQEGSSLKNQKYFALGLMLSIAYAANIGGTITLIGTPPNVVMVGYLKEILDYNMAFSKWLLIGIPCGFLLLFITYWLLTHLLYPNKLPRVKGSGRLIEEGLAKLGPMGRAEKLVLGIFALTALGWIFKGTINGLLGFGLLSDTTTAMAGGMLMFIVPEKLNKNQALLNWDDTQRMPWGILILFGGGMCLARALEEVGIIQAVGDWVAGYQGISGLLLIFILTALVLFLTELMSNVALVTIFIPVAIGIAQGLNIDPLLIVVPCTLASSCAFMMPISTPPNAIVFASGHIQVKQMMKAGWLLNLVSIVVLTALSYGLVSWLFRN